MLPNKKDNTYNVDKTFDYFTLKAIAIQSIEKIKARAQSMYCRYQST